MSSPPHAAALDGSPGGESAGSVVLRLSGSRKAATTLAELRRLGRQGSGSLPLSRSFLQRAGACHTAL